MEKHPDCSLPKMLLFDCRTKPRQCSTELECRPSELRTHKQRLNNTKHASKFVDEIDSNEIPQKHLVSRLNIFKYLKNLWFLGSKSATIATVIGSSFLTTWNFWSTSQMHVFTVQLKNAMCTVYPYAPCNICGTTDRVLGAIRELQISNLGIPARARRALGAWSKH